MTDLYPKNGTQNKKPHLVKGGVYFFQEYRNGKNFRQIT